MRWSRAWTVALVAALGAVVVGVAVAAVTVPGRVGPQLKLLQSGRKLAPQGKLVTLGNFPTGGALTRDGHFYWTVSTGRGRNDIRIVSVRTAKVVQVIPLPGASGGIAMDPSSNTAYVSGVPDSGHKDAALPGAPGREGDVIHVFSYARDRPGHVHRSDPGAPAVRRAGAAGVPADQRRPEAGLARPARRVPRRQAPARAAQPRRRRRDRGRLLQAGAPRQDGQLSLRGGDPGRRQDAGWSRTRRPARCRSSTSTPAPRSRTSRSARTSVTPRRSPSTRAPTARTWRWPTPTRWW